VTTLAHGVGQSQDLPLPLDLVLQAGAATVVISFLGAALLWRRPRLGGGTFRPAVGTWWRTPLRVVVLVLALYVTGNALLGPPEPRNPAAHALFVWLWVGLVPVSVVAGPVWRAVNPLRTLFRLLRLPRSGFRPRPTLTASPWPAAAGLLAFVWLELLAPHRTDPRLLGVCLLVYALVHLVCAALAGEEWFARGDFFEVYSDLAGRLSPLRWRPPLSGLAADHPTGAGRAAFLAVWWGSTIFDSASGAPWWAGFLQRSGFPLPYGTAGLLLICGAVLLAVRRLSGRLDVTNSLIPVAVGYTLAHYLTLLLVEAPRGALLLLQQWGIAEHTLWNPILTPGVVAVLQVVLILTGHTLGVLAAHDMALAESPGRPPLATLADELPVVLFMIGCTWAGLFLLFVR
jgi:hypothetical protein